MSDLKKAFLEKQIQEAQVLNAELGHLGPSTLLYERQVPSSNIFFLAKDNNSVKSRSLKYQKDLERQQQEK